MTSHYSRADAPLKRFLNPGLNIKWMYYQYLEAEEPEVLQREVDITNARQERRFPLPPKMKLVVTEQRYHRIFNTEFNLGFGLP